ncbi:unnamed protein product [Ilex paraguariensis]|uniref:Uncharacterized protein n=1 Tax=Ilex paraguariensis TaxID=185542 RepID=A0ABC8SVV3_9AQUA
MSFELLAPLNTPMPGDGYCSLPSDSSPSLHVVLFPFMSKGHATPLLHLARLLLHRYIPVTIFTTPASRPFISKSLSDTTTASIIDLRFPENIAGVPPGVESTDKLPSMSLFVSFATATKKMKPSFEKAQKNSASNYDIPRLVFNVLGNFSMTLSRLVVVNRVQSETDSADELYMVTDFPGMKLTAKELGPAYTDLEAEGPYLKFVSEMVRTSSKSFGLIVNGFYELEPVYFDYWNHRFQPKARCVGPLCLVEPPRVESENYHKPPFMLWLDQKLAHGKSVLYAASGSQGEFSSEQF